ncbi:heme o synthase [Nisaea nitritireducens]|uniref:heme o synthase n=1 Tax=Nisaea nitritireducens TaxID=568392 RepID=UPI0018687F8B|nr:heme o synthase [Nisaea nitritireducens]
MSDTSIEIKAAAPTAASASQAIRDYLSLLKPRVMSLVVFTGFAGLYLAPGELNTGLAAIAVLCIAIGAGASGAINMWYDRDIDAVMTRTRGRPIPAGKVGADEALAFGVILSGMSVMVMGLATNWVAAALLAATIGFYVFIYTMWLKRRTPQNIVIGGASGALPPVIGWAAVTGDVTALPLVMFLMIFMWTPPHFWALSLYRSGDYEAAGVPMLPVVSGRRETQKQILIYTLLLVPVTLLPVAFETVGLLTYGLPAAAFGLVFLLSAWRVFRDASEKNCRRLFGYSILYLFVLFTLLIIDQAAGV